MKVGIRGHLARRQDLNQTWLTLSGPWGVVGNRALGARWQEAWSPGVSPIDSSEPARPAQTLPGQGWSLGWGLGCSGQDVGWRELREGRGAGLEKNCLAAAPALSSVPHCQHPTILLLGQQTLPLSPGRSAQHEEHSTVPFLVTFSPPCVPLSPPLPLPHCQSTA